jgi:hypothetical protein
MDENLITFGCLRAKVVVRESGEITSASEGDIILIYSHTIESDTNNLIVTTQMRLFGDASYLPIAIVRIDPNDPREILLHAVRGLSEELQLALEQQGCELVDIAPSLIAGWQDESEISN